MHGIDFLKAVIIGILVVAPLGPVGLLFIRKSLFKDFKGVLAIGLGSGLVDVLYAGIASQGFFVQDLFRSLHWMNYLGGCFLIFLAIYEVGWKRIQFSPSQDSMTSSAVQKTKFWPLMGLGFFLTMINFLTPAGMIALAAALKISLEGLAHQMTFIIGVGLGVTLWWTGLGWGTYGLSRAFSDQTFQFMHRGICALLFIAGLFMLGQGLWQKGVNF